MGKTRQVLRGNGSRVVFVDVLRLLATFQMVQGHTVDSVLRADYRDGPLFATWSWIRGLTSVAFLFAAGLAFYITTLPNLREHQADRQTATRRYRRGVLLVVVGYLLHLPLGAFGAGPEQAQAAWNGFFIADILQCMGITLICLEWAALRVRSSQSLCWGCAAVATVLVLIAPFTDAIAPQGRFAPLLHYVSHRGGSFFPLIPWSAYMLFGVAFGGLSVVRTSARIARMIGAGALALLIGWAVPETTASPGAISSYVFTKLGAIMLFCAVIAWGFRNVERLPRTLETLTRETLFIYTSHVFVLYAHGVGLLYVVGRRFSVGFAVAVALGMVTASLVGALLWNALKRALISRSQLAKQFLRS